jgi:hypothetical protein
MITVPVTRVPFALQNRGPRVPALLGPTSFGVIGGGVIGLSVNDCTAKLRLGRLS